LFYVLKFNFILLQADPRFIWNHSLMEELIENKVTDIVTEPKVVERHFRDVMQRYGETIAVDLTDKLSRYLLINTDGEILLEQNGILRVNCVDCLDRTNVTQVCEGNSDLNFLMCSKSWRNL
ncbi:hypothetical protein B296_00048811, partial [Ensete ventricosum]